MTEIEFRSVLNKTADISLFDYNKIVDKEYDYINYIDVVVEWKAVIYASDYGITSIFPVVNKVSIEMNYQWQSETDDDVYGDRDFKLTIDDFGDENLERKYQEFKDKKWIVKEQYDREDDETNMFIKTIDIDFEQKRIDLEF